MVKCKDKKCFSFYLRVYYKLFSSYVYVSSSGEKYNKEDWLYFQEFPDAVSRQYMHVFTESHNALKPSTSNIHMSSDYSHYSGF